MGALAGQGELAQQKPSSGKTSSSDAQRARRARARLIDRVVTAVLWTLAVALAVLLLSIVGYMIARGIGVLSWDFVTKYDGSGNFVAAQLYNTFYIVGGSLLLCVPVAVGAAIYLAEYARPSAFTTVVRVATETLAGVPSIILGLFGFLIFVTNFGEGHRFGYSRLAGLLTLTILNLPLLLRVAEDAVRSVPNELREASISLGANKFQTVWRVLLPAGLPALTTGIILTAGKMIGETAAILYTAGGSTPVNNWLSLDPLSPGDTLTVHLYILQSEGLQRNAVQVENGISTLLIVLLLMFNLGFRWLASLIVTRLSGRRA
jgi:phosphate transport system permease protein